MKTIDVAVDRSLNGPMPEYFVAPKHSPGAGLLDTFTYEYFDFAQQTRHRLLQVAFFHRRIERDCKDCVWLPITTFVYN